MQFCEAGRNPLRRKTSESLLKFLAIGAYPAVMRPNFPIISINVSFPSSISFSNLLVGLINKMAFLLFRFCHGLLKLSLGFGFSLSPGRKILRRRHAANHTKFPSTRRSTRANASRFLPDNKNAKQPFTFATTVLVAFNDSALAAGVTKLSVVHKLPRCASIGTLSPTTSKPVPSRSRSG